jgi:methylase of polypeptide subunit release factors
MKNMTNLSHQLLNEVITKESTVIDATMGNGYDTVFLAKHAKKVYAFDIQQHALQNTKLRLTKENLSNVSLILDSHENIRKYINEKIDAAIFNLGYLPGSDKSIITTGNSTIAAIKQILPLLNAHGMIILVIYIGHKGGLDESYKIEDYVKSITSENFLVSKYQIINATSAPYIIQISKA